MTLGELIKKKRIEKNLSVKELSKKSGVTAGTIYKVELGKKPSYLTIHKLARGLECDLEELWSLL